MIAGLRRLQTTPVYTKVLDWAKLISITGSTQVLVQAVSFISGILIIRLLPVEEYGYYTIANTMLGTMALLSDGGISTGVMAQGGKVWQSKEKLGEVLVTGLGLRRRFAIFSLAVSLPILAYLLYHHGASTITVVLITLSLIPAFFAALSDSLLEIIPKLHQDINPLQANQASVSLWRLVLTAMTLFLFPVTFVAILASGLPRIYGNIRLKKIAEKYIDAAQQPSKEVKDDILKIVKRMLPGAIYYCVSGQITLWLISIFGNTKSVAEFGALGRLTIVLTLFSAVFTTLVVPRFARLNERKSALLRRFVQLVTFTAAICAGVVVFFCLFPKQVLFLLGNKYAGLEHELLLIMIGSCIGLLWGVIFNLYSSRGWVINPALSITISIAAIVAGVCLFDVSTIEGALCMNIFIAVVEFIYHLSFGVYKIVNVD